MPSYGGEEGIGDVVSVSAEDRLGCYSVPKNECPDFMICLLFYGGGASEIAGSTCCV